MLREAYNIKTGFSCHMNFRVCLLLSLLMIHFVDKKNEFYFFCFFDASNWTCSEGFKFTFIGLFIVSNFSIAIRIKVKVITFNGEYLLTFDSLHVVVRAAIIVGTVY